ncbi:MAG: hypothetical protein GX589_09450 [Deltaproteobacteria bacterium]|nr:hypothetical protein [Deltaproteobacteria bacterium]
MRSGLAGSSAPRAGRVSALRAGGAPRLGDLRSRERVPGGREKKNAGLFYFYFLRRK